MPIPLLKHNFCRRGTTGPKAHAHAAYLSGTKLDDGYGRTADFTPKGGILHAEIWTPADAPAWAKDRGELWRRLEAREDKSTRRAKAILAHKFIGALPHELSFEENVRYVKDFVREQFTRRGYAADWAIHAPDPGSDGRNFHVHIMVPLRKFENGDWAKTKDRFPKNSPALSQYIKEKQQSFFDLQNRYLKKNGIQAEIIRQNGRWTVNTGPTAPTRSSIIRASTPVSFAALHLPVSSIVIKPVAQPVVLNQAKPIKAAFRLVRHAITATHKNKPAISLPFAEKKGWPEAAIIDWETWGYKNPPRFFALWPELSPQGFSPGGGFGL